MKHPSIIILAFLLLSTPATADAPSSYIRPYLNVAGQKPTLTPPLTNIPLGPGLYCEFETKSTNELAKNLATMSTTLHCHTSAGDVVVVTGCKTPIRPEMKTQSPVVPYSVAVTSILGQTITFGCVDSRPYTISVGVPPPTTPDAYN